MRFIHIAATVAALAFAVAPALAGKGGNGNGHGGNSAPAPASCSVSGGVVSATGLPTDQLINFMVNDASGTWGWVLGFTDDGTWNVNVPAPNGATTYGFASRTWGPNGSKYDVFASCPA
jgi:hypothetical protein